MADAYRVLNVSPNASLSEIRSAYLELACQHHPCKLSAQHVINTNANHTQFRLAAEAYAVVGDDTSRELYDLIKPSDLFRKSAGRYVDENEGCLATERLGRSRARSELTIDLRDGLPPELRALLTDLDPVKVFNRVVCQIDQERRAHQEARQLTRDLRSSPSSCLEANNNDSSSMTVPPSKYLSPPSRFFDESSFPRASHTKSPTSRAVREEGGISKQQPLNGALKAGILRDETKSQFRQSPSSTSELLSRDHGEPYQSSVNSETKWESIRSSGYSTSSSSYISSAGSSRGRNHRSRRVSFSNDVIESEKIKQARQAVKSFKSEAARMGSKPISTNPTSLSPRHSASSSVEVNNETLRGLVNKFGVNTQGITTSPPSSYKKPSEFLDKSLYSDFCSPIDSIPQDVSIKPIGIGGSRDSHGPSSTGRSRSSHALKDREIDVSHRHCAGRDEPQSFAANSAPTGFLARYRADQDLLTKNLPSYHLHQQAYHRFPWSDPNFDNPHSILLNHRSRDVN